MALRTCLLSLVVFAFIVSPMSLFAVVFPFSDSTNLELKGGLTYTGKIRTEDPQEGYALGGVGSKGNENFKKGDFVNNKGLLKAELKFEMPYLVLFGKGEAFYDKVYADADDDFFPEGTNVDVAKTRAGIYYQAQEYYFDFFTDLFTLRVGKQVVEWGESLMPVMAPGVGVVNIIDGSRAGAAGYTFRDYKVPSLMAWATYELSESISVEGVYAPDFDPRYTMSPVGTFSSFMDIGSFGEPGTFSAMGMSLPLEHRRPMTIEDQQQYGGAVRTVWPSLGNFEIGFYYFHYYDWSPLIKLEGARIVIFYEDVDMYGIALNQVFEALKDTQISGELAYRPKSIKGVTLEASGIPAGGEEVRTLNWSIGLSNWATDILSFTPFLVGCMPQVEVYGGYNMDYNDKLDEDSGLTFDFPEHIVYYSVAGRFDSPNLIDNTKLFLMIMVMGGLHEEVDSVHGGNATLTAKIGDSFEIVLGYEYNIGRTEEAMFPPLPDRDAFTFAFTVYLN